ncbi:MAG: hypothetical protein KDI29_17755, partial [Pseudomonadales bacterium]|nr:hypothetical protein [Pseudomonadales bacterium]
VVRISNGLFSSSQYRVLEQSIENNIRRGAWEAVADQLDHLQWLYSSHFEGDTPDQVERLMWVSERYLQAATSDMENRQVEHLKSAIRLNSLAYRLLDEQQTAGLETRVRVAYSLVKKYHMEIQGIRHGGEVGFSIRSEGPNTGRVEERKRALRKRYVAGLHLLHDLREQVQQTGPDNVEALAMVDLGIADWELLFNKRKALEEYPRLYERLAAEGIETARLDALFAAPATLPQPELYLDLDEALADRDPAPGEPITLIQLSSNFPGIIGHAVPDPAIESGRRGRFLTTEAELSIDPFSSSSHWLNGTLRTNWGTGSNIRLTAAPEDLSLAKEVAQQLQEVHIRPVLVAGEMQESELKVRYLVRRNEAVREYSVLDSVQLSQREADLRTAVGGGGD